MKETFNFTHLRLFSLGESPSGRGMGIKIKNKEFNLMNRFTTIFWDVDNTLLDFSYSMRHALTSCFSSIGRDMTEDILSRYSEINDSFWKRLELGEISRQELLSGRFQALFAECGIQGVDVDAFRQEYEEELGNAYQYLDDSYNVCKRLQKQVKQYVVTNGTARIQKKKLKLSGLAELMEGLFISEEIGTPKPHADFFQYCLTHVQEQNKSRILLVGDSLTSDIKGGVQAGIPTCWYRPKGTENPFSYRADFEISDLRKLPDMIGMEPDCG